MINDRNSIEEQCKRLQYEVARLRRMVFCNFVLIAGVLCLVCLPDDTRHDLLKFAIVIGGIALVILLVLAIRGIAREKKEIKELRAKIDKS